MKQNKNRFLTVLVVLAVILLAWSCSRRLLSPGKPEATTQEIFKGVMYKRIVRSSPHDMVIHVVTVKLSLGGVKTLVTPADNPKSDRPLNARSTSGFLEEFNLQIAVNGDEFDPAYVWGPIYYPHKGDPASPKGFAMSNGTIYSQISDEKAPMLILRGKRQADIGYFQGDGKHVISGSELLVDNGKVVPGLGTGKRHPRTAVGVNQAGTKLIIVVVDGRQPGYSDGATLTELAEILVENGAFRAMDLDGGGSSTLVMADENGKAVVLNSPVHLGIPGLERPVANHVGIYAKGK